MRWIFLLTFGVASCSRATPPTPPPPPIVKVDVHTHFGPSSVPRLLELMDRHGIDAVVNLSGGFPGGGLEEQLAAAAAAPGRIFVFATLDWREPRRGPGYGERLAQALRESRRLGAIGLKIPKGLGLGFVDSTGELIAVDAPELDVLFATAGELGMPVAIHTGDPVAFWSPATPDNERFEELSVHPGWSFHGKPVPSWEALFAALERRIARHPGTTFVSVHFGNAPEYPERVAALLEKHANLYIDTAARIPEIGRHPPDAMRKLFVRHRDRILFGTDLGVGRDRWDLMLGSQGAEVPTERDVERFFSSTWRYFETADRGFEHPTPVQGRWTIDGVALPPGVLHQVYGGNAMRVLGITVSARERLPPGAPRTLIVKRSGEGTVRSDPPGIACGQTCEARFPEGTEVALEATPQADTAFFGWWGACTGTASCRVRLDELRTVSARFESVRRPAWKTQLGGAQHDLARDVVVDPSGHVYVAMQSQDTSGAPPRIDVVKLAPAGAPIWTTSVEETRPDSTAGVALALAPDGGVYVTGGAGGQGAPFLAALTPRGEIRFRRRLEDGLGEARDVAVLDASVVVAGDGFVGAWDDRGARRWIVRAPGLRARAVAVGGSGAIAVGGAFAGTVHVGKRELVSSGDLDGFVVLIERGEPAGAWAIGGGAGDLVNDVAWQGETILVAGARDGGAPMIAAYDRSGTQRWEITAKKGAEVRSVVPLAQGLVVTGSFTGTLTLGRSALTARAEDTFLAILGEEGQALHLQRLGGSKVGAGGRVASLAGGELVVAATFADDLDIGGGGAMRSQGPTDAIVARLLP